MNVTQSTSAPSSIMIAVPTQDSSNALYISVSVIGSVMAILATSSIIVIAVTICLRRRVNRKLTITTTVVPETVTDNVAYGMNLDVELSDNITYTTATNKARNYEHSLEHTVVPETVTDNVAYGMNLDVELSDNIAYTTATNKARNYEHSYEYIISSGNNDTIIATQNEAYGIITNEAESMNTSS